MGEQKPVWQVQESAEPEVSQDDPWAVLDRIRAAFAKVPDEEIEAELDRAIAEIRAEARTGADRD